MLFASLTTLLAATASFGGVAMAGPIARNAESSVPKGSMRLGAVPSQGGVMESLMSLERTYRKYNVPMPPKLVDGIRDISEGKTLAQLLGGSRMEKERTNPSPSIKKGGGDVEADPANKYDTFYTSILQVGTPPQSIPVLLDTGSSDFWLFSNETPKEHVSNTKVYDIGASSSSKKLDGASWSINYVDGSGASGDVYTDVVAAGNLTVPNQAIGSVEKTTDEQAEHLAPASGIVGLGFSVINTVRPTQQKTFWENALSNMKKPLFTVNFKRGETGSINFGDIDESEYSGDITYVPLTEAKWWDVAVDGYSVGKNATKSSNLVGAVDTGTTVLVLQDEIVDDYLKQVSEWELNKDYNLLLYKCAEKLPDLTLCFGKHNALVPGELLKFQPVTREVCAMSLLPASAFGLKTGILGGPLFRSQFIVFNGEDKTVGFANKS